MATEFIPHRDGEEQITTADFFGDKASESPGQPEVAQSIGQLTAAGEPAGRTSHPEEEPATAIPDYDEAFDIADGEFDPVQDGAAARSRVELYGGAFGLRAAGVAMRLPRRRQRRPNEKLRALKRIPGEPLIKRG